MPRLLVLAHQLHPGSLYFSLVNGLPVPQRDVFAHWRFWAFAHAVSTPCHSLPLGPLGDSSIILQPQVYFPESLGSHLLPREYLTTLYSPISSHPCSPHYPGHALRVPSISLIFTSLMPKNTQQMFAEWIIEHRHSKSRFPDEQAAHHLQKPVLTYFILN